MAKIIVFLCALILLGLSVYYGRRRRLFHAFADLLLALGLLGIVFSGKYF